MDERRADRQHRVVITITGSQINLDGAVAYYADMQAAVDAGLWVGEADFVLDRICVGQPVRAD
jgi:hypothetical protein